MKTNRSGYIGVTWRKRDNKWQSQITYNRVHKVLGTFNTKDEAAITYNNAAIEYFGEFAVLNKSKDITNGQI